ncbi:hypothetical protein L4D20_11740 [Vibrio kyushuensis]|uniref:nickel/cobalt transporter n=1 Tax=Vibrio kyushuensis TaxID=2910249 RepID=UPI003D0B2C72
MTNKQKLIIIGTLTLLVILITLLVWWPTLWLQSLKLERVLTNELGELLYDIQDQKPAAISTLIVVSFLYGLLHSLGAGHGKFLVTSYLITNKSSILTALFITITSAFLQAFVAIVIIEFMIDVYASSMEEMYNQIDVMIRFSYGCVIALGFYLMFKSIRSSKENNASIYGIILAVGLRPCTGAVMVLLFSNMINLRDAGAISALTMAFGTALTTSIIACVAVVTKNTFAICLGEKSRFALMVLKFNGGVLLVLSGYFLITRSNVLGLIQF